jgi:hypothetical protein
MLDLAALRLRLLNGFRLSTPNDSQARDACCQALAQVIAEDEQLRAEVGQLRTALVKAAIPLEALRAGGVWIAPEVAHAIEDAVETTRAVFDVWTVQAERETEG